ncbi:hypothetical protein O1611_g3852 [Lasiodiplodia mahajangana]|uniref:Uncharacterized protein n=1 Tax=Lasiodiplodia mahajangana TaxID=1108764 RepID=A0ACC2JR85_9PEZI|nr:hypothetical protein O1611_g3852 [Lasiodiplodia mahajangana]
MYPRPLYPPFPGPLPAYAPPSRPYPLPYHWNGVPPNLALPPPHPIGSRALVPLGCPTPGQMIPYMPPQPSSLPMPPPIPSQWYPAYIPPDRSYPDRLAPYVDVRCYNTGRELWHDKTERRERPERSPVYRRRTRVANDPITQHLPQVRQRKTRGGSTVCVTIHV